jgi:uncharacterized protein (DUF2267 family)
MNHNYNNKGFQLITRNQKQLNGHRIRNKHKSMNFEEYASEGNRIIHEVAFELGTDRNRAARIMRAVLHAIRDRIPPDDAIEFAQGLPMALKGVFVDRYDISKTPVRIRSREKFLDFIYNKGGLTSPVDFPDRESLVNALQAVFTVLERNMDYGQVHQIKNMMNIDIVDLIDGY